MTDWTRVEEAFPKRNRHVLGIINMPFTGGTLRRVGLVLYDGVSFKGGQALWSEAGQSLDEGVTVTHWKAIEIPPVPED